MFVLKYVQYIHGYFDTSLYFFLYSKFLPPPFFLQ